MMRVYLFTLIVHISAFCIHIRTGKFRPRLTLYGFRNDAVQHQLVTDRILHGKEIKGWNYWYYSNGMHTSTDDVLVSLVALNNEIQDEWSRHVFLGDRYKQTLFSNVYDDKTFYYADLGCGIASILLLVVNGLLTTQYCNSFFSLTNNCPVNVVAHGLEVQKHSASLAERSVASLFHFPNIPEPKIAIQNRDIREINGTTLGQADSLLPLIGQCNLLTANPPYFPASLGSHSADLQRRNARFELHGGIEDYCLAAKELLHPVDGLFVFSFPVNKDCHRAELALNAAGLKLMRKTMILAGKYDAADPYLCIYEAAVGLPTEEQIKERLLDIRRVEGSNKLNPLYYEIQRSLNMAPRPLKRRERNAQIGILK